MTTLVKTMTEEQARELANEIIRLEATVKAMKAELKKYVEENGALNDGENVWNIQETVSWRFNADTVQRFMNSLVIDGYTDNPYELVSFSKPKLDKLGLNDSYIEQFAEKRVSKRFTKRKAKK